MIDPDRPLVAPLRLRKALRGSRRKGLAGLVVKQNRDDLAFRSVGGHSRDELQHLGKSEIVAEYLADALKGVYLLPPSLFAALNRLHVFSEHRIMENRV
jgi:hypothetical protein